MTGAEKPTRVALTTSRACYGQTFGMSRKALDFTSSVESGSPGSIGALWH